MDPGHSSGLCTKLSWLYDVRSDRLGRRHTPVFAALLFSHFRSPGFLLFDVGSVLLFSSVVSAATISLQASTRPNQRVDKDVLPRSSILFPAKLGVVAFCSVSDVCVVMAPPLLGSCALWESS